MLAKNVNENALPSGFREQARPYKGSGFKGERSVDQAEAGQVQALHLELPGQGAEGGVEHVEAESAADFTLAQRRVGQYHTPGAVTVELLDNLGQRLPIEDQHTAPPTGGAINIKLIKAEHTVLGVVTRSLALLEDTLGRAIFR